MKEKISTTNLANKIKSYADKNSISNSKLANKIKTSANKLIYNSYQEYLNNYKIN